MDNNRLLEIDNLHVSFFTPAGEVKAVNGISYTLDKGEVIGIVGESGSGKSVEAYSIIGLLQSPGKITEGKIMFDGENIIDFDENRMEQFRGNRVSMIFQNPMTSLNPVYTIGNQLVEALRCHQEVSKDEATAQAVNMLKLVGINKPERRIKQFPHELSGGMRQRVMIAMALICNPELLIADEPTTALDVTIQAQIIELIKEIQSKTGMAVIFITHNLGVVADICNKVVVMYAGKIVESASVNDIFYNPVHPYTLGLLRSMPKVNALDYEKLVPISGTPVDMLNLPQGCAFGPRCEKCMKICLKETPPKVQISEGHEAYCWFLAKEAFEEGKANG
jgi:oligopeptide transport system ATP-binding protein